MNGDATEHELDPGAPGTTVLPLPKRTKVRTLAVELLEVEGDGPRGVAELGLR